MVVAAATTLLMNVPDVVQAQVSLPYTVDFETAEGFSAGSLHQQGGWTVATGSAQVITTAAFSGTNSVSLLSGGSAAVIAQSFTPYTTQPVVFVDFFVQLVATTNAAATSSIAIEGAKVRFMKSGSVGTFDVFSGNGAGGGAWVATGTSIALDASDRATAWVRLTVRLDFDAKKWDLFINGVLAKFDLGFLNNGAPYLAAFSLNGVTAAEGYFDFGYAGPANPLFLDGDYDGMDDAWESSHGLNLSSNDRALDPDSDTLTNIREFQLGTNPFSADSDADGLSDASELIYGRNPNVYESDSFLFGLGGLRLLLRADQGITLTGGLVSTWADGSGLGNNLTQATAANRPAQVTSVINGYPVVRFDGSNDSLSMPNFMSGATAGDAFVVLKSVGDTSSRRLWKLGGSSAGSFYRANNGDISEDFGSTVQTNLGNPVQPVDQYHLYNVAAAAGSFQAWLNGKLHALTTSNAVAFPSTPTLGTGTTGSKLLGDIAEILVYDRVLSAAERESVARYLTVKYNLASIPLPAPPPNFVAAAISASQVSLAWEAPVQNARVVYTIERRQGSGSFVAVTEVDDDLSYVDGGLSPDTAYVYRVEARTYAGESAYGPEVQVTTLAQADAFSTSGLRMWLVSGNGTTVTQQGIMHWRNQVNPAQVTTQATSTSRPQLVSSATNGRPVVRFDGSNDSLSMPNFMSGAIAGDAFVVLKSVYNGSSRSLWKLGGASGGSYYQANSGDISEDFGSTVQTSLGNPMLPVGEYHLYNVAAAAGSFRAWLNGKLYASTTSNTVSFPSTPILASGNASKLLGDIAEVLIYDRVLSTAERESVGRYLTVKYDLASIPVPAPPANFVAAAVSTSQVSLAWEPSVQNARVVYAIERRVGSGSFVAVTEVDDDLSYVDAGLSSDTVYSYRVKARTYAGESAYGPEVQVSTAAQAAAFSTSGLRMWLVSGNGTTLTQQGILHWRNQVNPTQVATQATTTSRPQLVLNAANGRPVVGFDGTSDNLSMPNFMSGATAGDAFVVLKSVWTGSSCRLWRLGTSSGGAYYRANNGSILEDFGSTVQTNLGGPLQPVDQYHLYNVASAAGSWRAWQNGQLYTSKTSNTVGFYSAPTLGSGASGSKLLGDVVEILIYDRVLSEDERAAVRDYVDAKYAVLGVFPQAPRLLRATALSGNQVSLSWQGSAPNPAFVYDVERKTAGGSFSVIASLTNATSFIDTDGVGSNVDPNTTYAYRVRARLGQIVSGACAELTVVTPAAGTDVPTSGVKLWLKADSGYDPGNATTWKDCSAAANNFGQSTIAARPAWTANAINGLPALRFDGTDDYVTGPATLSSLQAADVFVVLKKNPGAAGLWRFGTGAGNATSYPTGSGNTVTDGFGANAAVTFPLQGEDINTWHLYRVSSSAGQWTNLVNASPLGIRGPNVVSLSSAPWLCRNEAGTYFSGEIAELIIYDHTLNYVESERVAFYLNSKYAFSPVPFNFSENPTGDYDGDGLTNGEELAAGMNPARWDSDSDGMGDGWEVFYGLDPLVDDSGGDPDADGMLNGDEYLYRRNPNEGVIPDDGTLVRLRIHAPAQ